VTVLKDAASASIYGSRAVNGVIWLLLKEEEKDRRLLPIQKFFKIFYCDA
jgi:TonB-dependent SusC/RagA subfamily outer membrane receptor